MEPGQAPQKFSFVQSLGLTLLRVAIGWHFLYEGVVKLLDPEWSSQGYLLGSRWFLSDFFHWLASDPLLIRSVDLLNMAGVILVGLRCLLWVLVPLFTFLFF